MLSASLTRTTWQEVPTVVLLEAMGDAERAELPTALYRTDGIPLGVTVERMALPTSVEVLRWLEGCWAGPSGDGEFRECWTQTGLELSGTGEHITHRRSSMQEKLAIRDVDGTAVYVAQPAGSEPTSFPATSFGVTSSKDWSVVFENPEHDFPKRIEYRKKGDALTVDVTADGAGFTLLLERVPPELP